MSPASGSVFMSPSARMRRSRSLVGIARSVRCAALARSNSQFTLEVFETHAFAACVPFVAAADPVAAAIDARAAGFDAVLGGDCEMNAAAEIDAVGAVIDFDQRGESVACAGFLARRTCHLLGRLAAHFA